MMAEKNGLKFCKGQIERMLKRTNSRTFLPLITLGLLKSSKEENKNVFSNEEIKESYERSVEFMREYMGHEFVEASRNVLRYVGALESRSFFPSFDRTARNLSEYGVLETILDASKKRPQSRVPESGKYQVLKPYLENAEDLIKWVPERIKERLERRPIRFS